jgi:hypothetical protein
MKRAGVTPAARRQSDLRQVRAPDRAESAWDLDHGADRSSYRSVASKMQPGHIRPASPKGVAPVVKPPGRLTSA